MKIKCIIWRTNFVLPVFGVLFIENIYITGDEFLVKIRIFSTGKEESYIVKIRNIRRVEFDSFIDRSAYR